MDNLCLKGARAICESIGENPKNINELVRVHGLPAWKRVGKGNWRALQEDLLVWMREQRDRSLGVLPLESISPGVESELGDRGRN